MTINGQKASCLYDTGASRSIIRASTMRQFFGNNWQQQRFTKGTSNLRGAGNEILKCIGIYTLDFELVGHKMKHDFHVIINCNEDILGIDLINKYCLGYDAKTQQVYKDTLRTEENVATISSEVNLPALSTTVVKARFNGRDVKKEGYYIASIAHPEFGTLMGGPALVTISKDKGMYLKVINSGPVDIRLRRGEAIAEIEHDDAEEGIHEVTEEFFQLDSVNAIGRSSGAPSPSLSQDQIRKAVTLNVPDKFKQKYWDLLFKHAGVFSTDKTDIGRTTAFEHRIHLKDKEPVYQKQFKIPDAHRDFIEATMAEWLKLGVVQRSNSTYNSPIFCVPKKQGQGLRIVQDFRALNSHSYIDKYSMKEINECIGDIGRAGSTLFTTLDLTSGFWQMPIHPGDRHLTAFTVPGMGQFEWITSPMGLLGCPASFQRLMEKVLLGVKNCIVYIDDLLIHSHTHDAHLQTLDEVFRRLAHSNLKVNISKSVFGNEEVSYLGFTLTPEGIKPGKDKLRAIRDCPEPNDIKTIRSFIGLCNFFRTHIRNFSMLSAPLTRLTRKDSGYTEGPLPKEAHLAYQELKSALMTNPVVDYPRRNRRYALIVDASTGTDKLEGGLGAILAQIDENNRFRVISYGSRQLVKHEKNYSPFLLEMTAAVWGMEFYDEYLRGKHFTLYTDHKPLEKLGHLHKKTLNRLQMAMLEYDFEIQYKKGINMPADFLSRAFADTIQEIHLTSRVDEDPDFGLFQKHDRELQLMLSFLKNRQWDSSASTADVNRLRCYAHKLFQEGQIVWIRLNDYNRPRTALYLPKKYRAQMICKTHGSLFGGHEAHIKTYLRLTDAYWWPTVREDVQHHIQSCVQCQLHRKQPQKRTPLNPLPTPELPNERIHLDLFGPLKTSEKHNKYILTMTDAATKYAEAIAIPDKEAITVAKAIFIYWICKLGVPKQIHTDGGKEFCNKLLDALMKFLGITHSKTTPSHPECNAQAEVFNKTIAKYMSTFVSSTTLDWEDYVPAMVFSYNTSYHSTIKTTPFELTFGMKPRLPEEVGPEAQRLHYGEDFASDRIRILQQAREIANKFSESEKVKAKKYFDKNTSDSDLKVGDKVLYSETDFVGKNKKFAAKWTGPVSIVKIKGDVVIIKLASGKTKPININRLRKFWEQDTSREGEGTDVDEDSDSESEAQEMDQSDVESDINQSLPPDSLIKGPMTRARSKLNQASQINVISCADLDKLRRIAKKVFKLNAAFKPATLSSDELRLWQRFDKAEVFELLTGNPNRAPDYHEYLQCPWQTQAPPVVIAPAPVPVQGPAPAPLPQLVLPQLQPNVGPPASAQPPTRTSRPRKDYGPPNVVTRSKTPAGPSTSARGRPTSPVPGPSDDRDQDDSTDDDDEEEEQGGGLGGLARFAYHTLFKKN